MESVFSFYRAIAPLAREMQSNPMTAPFVVPLMLGVFLLSVNEAAMRGSPMRTRTPTACG